MTTENNGGAANGEHKETVMDAINEALGLGGENEHVEHQDPADTGAEDGDDLVEAGDNPDATGDTDEDGAGGEPGGKAPVGDKREGTESKAVEPPKYADLVKDAAKLGISERNANGTVKSGQQLATEIAAKKAGDDKSGADQAKQGTKKAPDALNDPIDKSLRVETQQRIRTLIDRTKEAEEKATTATQNFDFMVQGLQSVGATPEQYGETLSFLALFNSSDPKQQGQALDILEDMSDKLATLLGRERKSPDPLERHADLIAAVQKKEITLPYAREMARNRNQGAFRTELTTAAQNTQTQQQQAERELSTAREELNTLEQTLKANDPLYARKKAAIVPALKASFKHISPTKWKAAFQEAYDAVKIAPLRAVAKTPVQQPLRAGKNPAGSGANANGGTNMSGGGPASMREAIDAALAGR